MLGGFPDGVSGKEPVCQWRRHKTREFDPWLGKIPWRRAQQPTPVFLPGDSHGQRSLEGYSLQGCTELDMTEVTQHASRFIFIMAPSLSDSCLSFSSSYPDFLKFSPHPLSSSAGVYIIFDSLWQTTLRTSTYPKTRCLVTGPDWSGEDCHTYDDKKANHTNMKSELRGFPCSHHLIAHVQHWRFDHHKHHHTSEYQWER